MEDTSIAERARRLLESENKVVIEEPVSSSDEYGILYLLLILPILPFYLLFKLLGSINTKPKVRITEIEKTEKGYRILEYER